MQRVIHFEIAANNTERAVKFYKNVFGWDIQRWQGESIEYWLVNTGSDKEPGINGGIFKRDIPINNEKDLRAYRCTINVPSVDRYMIKVDENGGKIISPKMSVMGFGWLAFCEDTESNIFGLIENDLVE